MFNNLSRFPSATPVSPYSPAALFQAKGKNVILKGKNTT